MKKTVCHVVGWWMSRKEIIFTHRIKIHSEQKKSVQNKNIP